MGKERAPRQIALPFSDDAECTDLHHELVDNFPGSLNQPPRRRLGTEPEQALLSQSSPVPTRSLDTASLAREGSPARPRSEMTGPIHRRRLHSARDVLHSSESNEWYTPAQYIRPVRRLLGTIDLDPASCAEANAVVQATHFYTVEDDGLVQPWYGRVWLNPPYGKTGNKSNQEIWSQRLMTEYEAGNVQEAVLLVNAATDTIWFQKVWRYPICFVAGRIRFWRVEGVADSPTHGSALVYLGGKIERFGELFSTFGVVARAWKSSTPDR